MSKEIYTVLLYFCVFGALISCFYVQDYVLAIVFAVETLVAYELMLHDDVPKS